jgi:DnaD/phage-associated family protein
MEFSLNLGIFNNIVALPNLIVDKYLNTANFEQLKVLLWLLRHAGEKFSQKNIAEALNLNEKIIFDSINFWQNVEFLNNGIKFIAKNEFSQNNSAVLLNDFEQISPIAQNNVNYNLLQIRKKSAAKIINSNNQLKWNLSDEVPANIIDFDNSIQANKKTFAKRLKQSPKISLLVHEIEAIFEKKISTDEKLSLLNLFENQKLPPEAIIMLIQYAAKINKKNVKYAEKIAATWINEGIDSLEKIEQKIKSLNDFNALWNDFVSIVGIKRKTPYANEHETICRWFTEWKFSKELITEAFNRCFAANKKYILRYMDSIVTRWKNQGISTLGQALEETKIFTINSKKIRRNNQFANKPSYDLEAYEKHSIFD